MGFKSFGGLHIIIWLRTLENNRHIAAPDHQFIIEWLTISCYSEYYSWIYLAHGGPRIFYPVL